MSDAISENKLQRVSKYLSYILRHKPESIGLILDANGWASIASLIDKTTQFSLNASLIKLVVETNDKQRFSISDDGQQIRANQGHSIEVDLALEEVQPPEILLHGTAENNWVRIQMTGLNKMHRHHVHLSEHEDVARAVGSRYGKPLILHIDALNMYKQGHKFFKSTNNVWLVEHVPIAFIHI